MPLSGQSDLWPWAGRIYLFSGSDAGGDRVAVIYTIVETCKMNGINPQAYLADVIERIADHPANRVDELLPWNWTRRT
jgi:hypothetical protein